MLTLSPRLQKIADYVPAGSRIIDVGTDHAYIPIYLLERGLADAAVASDLKPGPLQNAAADAEKYGVAARLQLRLCDGLAGITPEDGDTVIIAGMGGETIMGILAAAPWAWGKRLILQPQTKLPELRAWLADHGCRIVDASLSYDAGRLYLIWLVGPGEMGARPAVDPELVEKRDPLLRPYCEGMIKQHRKQLQGLERASARDEEKIAALQAELAAYEKLHREAETWQR